MVHEVDLPLPSAAPLHAVLEHIARCVREGVAVALATVLTRRGSAPSTPGQKLCLDASGLALGTVGGGALERTVLEAMVARLASVRAAERVDSTGVLKLELGPSLGMCCGGGVEVLLEVFVPARSVLLVGGGHVATALVPVLLSLGFRVTVSDEREHWSEESRLVGATVVHGSASEAGRTMDRSSAVLAMTHDHVMDQDAIEWALREGFALVGGVGSRAKCARTKHRLEAKGFSEHDRARVRMPFGADVGARSPEEIAVAIAAELIAWRRGKRSPEVTEER